ncbi:MAG: GNAT family N-acetyltransferase [Acidobacteria bacterium]|nr:GNAT family N-acetyltransferase [Acidobacteriota bacterium]
MIIRSYKTEDLEVVANVFRSNIPKYFSPSEEPGLCDFLRDHAADYYVLELNGEVVASGGIAFNDLDSPTVSLCWGMVRKDHLGTGLGKALTQFRIDLAREKYGQVPLTIGTSQHTQGFYETFGFHLVEHTPNGFGPGIDPRFSKLLVRIGLEQ